MALQLAELAKVKVVGKAGNRQGEIRERIGKVIGMSGHNVDRYLNVLATPREVQNAFCDGRLSLVVAANVALLDKKDQGHIASLIRGGHDDRTSVRKYLPPSCPPAVRRGAELPRFVRDLVLAMNRLKPHVDNMAAKDLVTAIPKLARVRKFIRKLTNRAEAGQASSTQKAAQA